MSSFFRNPNDVTESEDQTYDEDETGEDETGHEEDDISSSKTPSKAITRIETLESATSSTNDLPLSRQLTDDGETKEWVMRALMEKTCLQEALADFQSRDPSGQLYTKDHPDVQALAKAKYEYMADMLSRASILSAGPERISLASASIKQHAKDGLDYISTTSPRPGRPGVLHRNSSLLSASSALRDLSVASGSAQAIGKAPLYQQQAMNHSMEAMMGLPPLLRPLVDHPMFELSRYLRDFHEVRMIGKGGYGKVYHVQHRLDGSNYAVKKINLNAHRLKRIQERGQIELDSLLKELRMLAKFDHPNIVRYYGGWLEYSTATPFPSPAPNGKLMIEDRPIGPEDAHGGARNPDFDSDSQNYGTTDTMDLAANGSSSKRGSVDILFERSGGEILGDLDEMDEEDDLVAELQPQIKTQRKRANSSSTTASIRSKMSSVHSVGADEDEDKDDDVESVREGMHLLAVNTGTSEMESLMSSTDDVPNVEHPKVETGSVLTLHIQMALHPLSLADYLAPSPVSNAPPAKKHARHCFHLKPALQILLSILDGVQYLHESGVVHRDLKPSNVFLTLNPSRTPACIDLSKCNECQLDVRSIAESRKGFLGTRIGDFGLVTEIARAKSMSSQAPTGPAKAVGTELYRPPMLSSSETTTSSNSEKLDVYALGIILVELLMPFGTRMERQQTLVKIRAGSLEDTVMILRHGEHGKALWELVRGMTHVNEASRWTCEQVREKVDKLFFGLL